MEFRNIVAFLRVAECESFTKAAAELGYVQSTLSIRVQQLEREVGVALFERIGKRVMLTLDGERFLEYAKSIAEISEQALLLAKRPEELVGRLRIGILESLIVWVFSDCIPQFQRKFPLISVETKTASGKSLLRMLKRNELDMVFLLDRKISEKYCSRVFSRREEIVFVTHPDNPLARRHDIDLRDVVRETLVLTESDSAYRLALEAIAAERDIHITPLIEVDNTTAITRILQNGVGISFLPKYAVSDFVERGKLAIFRVKSLSLHCWGQIFYHAEKWVSPQMAGFTDIIKAHFAGVTVSQEE